MGQASVLRIPMSLPGSSFLEEQTPMSREIRPRRTGHDRAWLKNLSDMETQNTDFRSRGAFRTLHWKHTLDALLILLALPFLIPLTLLIALLIRSGSSGPVLFKQERVGYLLSLIHI